MHLVRRPYSNGGAVVMHDGDYARQSVGSIPTVTLYFLNFILLKQKLILMYFINNRSLSYLNLIGPFVYLLFCTFRNHSSWLSMPL